jgi:tetraacyldisaccharide 4'-kinase
MIWRSKPLSSPLWPVSILYAGIMKMRNWLYEREIISSFRLNVRVISIGNITVGGTGKTPLVDKLARLLKKNGKRVVILSRGYKRKGRGEVVVSNGKEILVSSDKAGDEPFLLAKRLSKVPIVVGNNRVKTGKIAMDIFRCDVLIIDDGFQHLNLKRDMDIVVMDASNPWGNGWMLPAGPLRENISSLKRADLVMITRTNRNDVEKMITLIRKFTKAQIFSSFHKPKEWVTLNDGVIYPLNLLINKCVLAFTGIGNPKAFEDTLLEIGVRTIKCIRFRDHHKYKLLEIKRIMLLAEKLGATAIVTTEKDGVKIDNNIKGEIPIYFLRVDLEIKEGDEEFIKALDSVLIS